MRKILCLLLTAAMLLPLCACGAKEESVTDRDTKPSVTSFNKQQDGLEGIMTDIEQDYAETLAKIQNGLAEVNKAIGGDYKAFKKNESKLYDWCESAISESDSFIRRTEEKCKQYCFLMEDEVEHEYDEMDEAAEEIYDRVYDGVLDDFYDDIYDDLMDDVYDDYYDDMMDKAYDQLPYQEYSEQHSAIYKLWSDTSSAIYHLWSQGSSHVYEMWSAMSSAIYRDNYDFKAVIADYEKELKEEEEKVSVEQEKGPEAAEEETADAKVAEQNNGGMRPEFKEAMDGYEAFFDEYVAFMQKMSSDPGDFSMLAEYATFMLQYEDTMEKLDEIDEEDLSTEELAYYIEVTARIEQKLLSVY